MGVMSRGDRIFPKGSLCENRGSTAFAIDTRAELNFIAVNIETFMSLILNS